MADGDNNSSLHIFDLSDPLLALIFVESSFRERINLSRTCKRFYRVSKAPHIFQVLSLDGASNSFLQSEVGQTLKIQTGEVPGYAIEAWIKPSFIEKSDDQTKYAAMILSSECGSLEVGSGNHNDFFLIQTEDGKKVVLGHGSVEGEKILGNFPVRFGTWNHVCVVTRLENGWVEIFLNGRLDCAAEMSPEMKSLFSRAQSNRTITLGASIVDGRPAHHFVGEILAVNIWERPRPRRSSILNFWNHRMRPIKLNEKKGSTLSAHWNFETGSTADLTGNGWDFSLNDLACEIKGFIKGFTLPLDDDWVEQISTPGWFVRSDWKSVTRKNAAPVVRNDPNQPPQWDEVSACCGTCGTSFDLFWTRRHHCRHCGGSFCDTDSKWRIPIPKWGMTKPVRVCEPCYNQVKGEE